MKRAATCEEKGITTYIAAFEEDWAKTQTLDVEDLAALTHGWTVRYDFTANGSKCTATRVCANNPRHNVTANAVVTSQVKIPATCTEKGTTTYTATFDADWAADQTLDVMDIKALKHTWTVEYDFAADGSKCTATRVCGNDAEHNETAEAAITSAVKRAATCAEKGTTSYTANFDVEWAIVQILDVVDLEATGAHIDKKPADAVCDICSEELSDLNAKITTAMNEDYSKITVEIADAVDYQEVYVELTNGSGVFRLACKQDENGNWYTTANLCEYVVAGIYTVRGFGVNENGTKRLGEAGVNVLLAVNHTYTDSNDKTCDICGAETKVEPDEEIPSVPMFRMYNPNSGEHFYTGSEEERNNLVKVGWKYEGVGFNAPVIGEPVYRIYEPTSGEHLYTMDRSEVYDLLNDGWNYESVAWNSAEQDEIVQYRLRNPNSNCGRYHFTSSKEERDNLISLGWINEGIGWYSCLY